MVFLATSAAGVAAFAEDAFTGVEMSGVAGGSSNDEFDYKKLKKQQKGKKKKRKDDIDL